MNSAGGAHRPSLDGLRTIAVFMVVAFHAGVVRLSGGFIGVDVFFVLSGFLVTGVLTRHLASEGATGLGGFYARRMRRLVPAATATLVITAVAFRWILLPSERAAVSRAVQAAFLQYANWHYIAEATDYFADDIAASPVLHFWSLAVEVQFYLVWPLVLGALMYGARRLPWRPDLTMRVGAAAIGAVSLATALSLQATQLDRAYYGTDTRAYQFMIGALASLSPGVVRWFSRQAIVSTALSVASVVVLALLATDHIGLQPVSRGALAAVATVVLIVTIDASSRWFRGFFCLPPITYLGRISYGIYLWHWPVIVIVERSTTATVPIQLAAVAALVASGLAALSFELLERPILESTSLGRHHRSVILGTVVLLVVVGLAAVPTIVETEADRAHSAVVADMVRHGFTPIPSDLELDLDAMRSDAMGSWVDCRDRDPDACTVTEGSGEHVLLMGDSIGLAVAPGLQSIAESRGLTFSVALAPGCAWQLGVDFPNPDALAPCEEVIGDYYDRVVPALDPDVIVIVASFITIFPDQLDFLEADGLAVDLRDHTPRSLDLLLDSGRKVVVVEPLPTAPHHPVQCLEQAEWLEDCRYVHRDEVIWIEELYRDLAASEDRLWAADFDGLACPYLPICDPVVGGIPVRWDKLHLTQDYGATLSEPIETYLVQNGILSDDQ